MEFIQRGGIAIPRQYENEMWYREIRADLLRRSQKYNTPDFEILKFYLESEKFLTIPRFYPFQKFMKTEKVTIDDRRHEGNDIQIEHNIKPRNKIQKIAMQYMMEHDNGIIQLQPGVGKTVISIYMIAERKKKTFIIVHRDSLAEQWSDRIEQFTSIKSSPEMRLTSQNFKEALQQPIIISTSQTFLSLLKRNRIEFLKALHEANIGILLADEVHTTIGAPSFSECSIHMPCKVVFGLSATPYRWDGNGDIIEHHLGEIFAKEDDEGTMKPNITIIGFDFQIDTPKRHGYLYWAGKFQRSRYLNLMRKSEPLLKICKGIVKRLLDEDRQLVIMCERLKLIDELFKVTNSNSDNASIFTAGKSLEVLEKQTTFTTPGKMRDGVDAPWKDSMLLTSPISNIAQVVGRVTRTNKDKLNPAIIDMVDMKCPPIKNSIYGRIEFYEKKEWNINIVLCNKDGKLLPITKERFIELLN